MDLELELAFDTWWITNAEHFAEHSKAEMLWAFTAGWQAKDKE